MLKHLRFVQNSGSDSSAVLRRGRIVSSHNDLNLRENTGGCLIVGADEVEASSTLTVETHDLSEGLSDNHLEALVEEESETESILVEGSRSETLISCIKERVKLLSLADIGDLLPLSFGRVNTGGVVGTSVKENTGSGCCSF